MAASCAILEAWAASTLPLLFEWRLVAALAAALLVGAMLIAKLLAQRVPSIVVEPITGECSLTRRPCGPRALQMAADASM